MAAIIIKASRVLRVTPVILPPGPNVVDAELETLQGNDDAAIGIQVMFNPCNDLQKWPARK
jgi:hypothetical protein